VLGDGELFSFAEQSVDRRFTDEDGVFFSDGGELNSIRF
jgi:hypothetical protein